jgi:hypothetical protein
MLSKLSIITLLAATTFTSALPADSQKSVSRRQEDWNIWFVPLLVMRFYLFCLDFNPSAIHLTRDKETQPLRIWL